jgi:hypothetical protein
VMVPELQAAAVAAMASTSTKRRSCFIRASRVEKGLKWTFSICEAVRCPEVYEPIDNGLFAT